jgi:hydroxymethylpyrimidine pyrophosphatase-like HAD family hydrolase
VQVFELCRLLGLGRGVAELGCVHVDVAGHAVRYELGAFPFLGETPVEAMLRRGAVEAALDFGLEPFDRWNEGRVATYLLRAPDAVALDVAAASARLAERGFGWCELLDNGRAYHLAPRGTGKAFGVRADRTHYGLERADVAYVGDASSDLACAPDVSRCWLVANADAHLAWPDRTAGSYGDGVAEVIDDLLRVNR